MKIGIIGASGYTGLELLRILSHRPETEVVLVTSRQEAGQSLTFLFPSLSGLGYDHLVLEPPENLAGRAEIFFMAAPHGAAMAQVPSLLESGAKIIDLSADFRLKSPELFEKWYQPHSCPEYLAEAVYGLPELNGSKVSCARLVANPGCYPTSIILALAPLLTRGLIDIGSPIIADSKSGVTGAGRGSGLDFSFCEVQDNFRPYKVVGHRHTPEIVQELSLLAGQAVKLSFTPHLLPLNRGILSTIYVRPQEKLSVPDIRELYTDFYAQSPFVRIRREGYPPQTADVRGTNFCDLNFFYDHDCGLWKIVSAIDNLFRGASGQAVANLNLMTGHPQNYGLAGLALRP